MAASVDPTYRHRPKEARFLGLHEVGGSCLKLYEIAVAEAGVPSGVQALCDEWLSREAPSLLAPGDCGFVLLHRCGVDFYFLATCVWRESNELWEAVWYHQPPMVAFAPFGGAYPPAPGTFRPTFCVWEHGVVRREVESWSRYLASPRDDAALDRWKADTWSGTV